MRAVHRDSHDGMHRLRTATASPNLASHSRGRVLQHRLEHRLQSPGELLMTCSTSDVAVCCSSAS